MKVKHAIIGHVFQIFKGPILYLDSQAIIKNLIPGNQSLSHSEHFPGFKIFYNLVLQEKLLAQVWT